MWELLVLVAQFVLGTSRRLLFYHVSVIFSLHQYSRVDKIPEGKAAV